MKFFGQAGPDLLLINNLGRTDIIYIYIYIISTVTTNISVIGLPLFSAAVSLRRGPPSPVLPHPYSEDSCDSHSFVPSISAGTFLKTQDYELHHETVPDQQGPTDSVSPKRHGHRSRSHNDKSDKM